MGFPTPFSEWVAGEAREFVRDVFSSQKAVNRDIIDNRKVLDGLEKEPRYSRKVWGLLCLELWQQQFHDRSADFNKLLSQEQATVSCSPN